MTAGGRIALIGLGEVGRIFAEDLRAAGHLDITAWDTAFDRPQSPAARNRADLGLPECGTAAQAITGAQLVICAVTASRCVDAATSAAASITPGTWFFDLNSASPGHKVQASQAIDGAGGRYVEAALMSPIGPRRLESPFLLGGPHAKDFELAAAAWGLTNSSVVSQDVGRAAATKLCRSVIVKGFEALLMESLLTARTYGVEHEVVGSLSNILPAADWEQIAGYFISRSVQHGTRRAEEMEEAAATVAEAGLEPLMSSAAASRQTWAAQFGSALPADLPYGLVDSILATIRAEESR